MGRHHLHHGRRHGQRPDHAARACQRRAGAYSTTVSLAKMVNQGQFEIEAQLAHEEINLIVKWKIKELKRVHKNGALLRILWINPEGVGLEMVSEAALILTPLS